MGLPLLFFAVNCRVNVNLMFLLIILPETYIRESKTLFKFFRNTYNYVFLSSSSAYHPPISLWRKYANPLIFGILSPTQTVSGLGLITVRGTLGSVVTESFSRAPRKENRLIRGNSTPEGRV